MPKERMLIRECMRSAWTVGDFTHHKERNSEWHLYATYDPDDRVIIIGCSEGYFD